MIIIAAAVIALIIITVFFIKALGNYVNIRGQSLVKYEYSSGGGMTGGYYRKTVEKADETHARVIIEKAEWYDDEPATEEYITDIAILDELEGVIRRYRMNFWNNKKFSNTFVFDGESKSYTFRFDENSISFSSQVYPLRFQRKLNRIDEITKKYINDCLKEE